MTANRRPAIAWGLRLGQTPAPATCWLMRGPIPRRTSRFHPADHGGIGLAGRRSSV